MHSLLQIKKIAVFIAFLLSCIRPWLAGLGMVTSSITIAINILILLGFNLTTTRHIIFGCLYMAFVFICFSQSIIILFDIVLLSYLLTNYNTKVLAYINFTSSIIIVCFIIEFLGLGLIDAHTYVSHKGGVVYDFGFQNINTLALFLTNIVFMLSIVLSNKHKILFFFLFLLMTYAVYKITLSRTSFVSLLIFSFVYLINSYGIIGKKVIRFISLLPIIIIGILFCLLAFLTNIPELNTLSSGRLHIFDYWFNQMSISQYIFGIGEMEEGAYDGSFFMILIYGGLPMLCLMFLLFQKNLWKKYKDYTNYIPFIIGMLVYGISESNLVILSGMCLIFWKITLFLPQKYQIKYEHSFLM